MGKNNGEMVDLNDVAIMFFERKAILLPNPD